MPAHARRYLEAMGDRVVKRGKERSTFQATMELEDNSREIVRWNWEMPGKLNVQRGLLGKDRFSFVPGRPLARGLDTLQDNLLEVLSADTAENFLYQWQNGVVPRMLGDEFQVQGATGFGSRVDIFEMAAPVVARSQPGTSVKHYMFDSQSGLLSRITYQRMIAGVMAPVLTVLSAYAPEGGYPIPHRITRYHAKRKLFQIDVAAAEWSGGAVDGLFDAVL